MFLSSATALLLAVVFLCSSVSADISPDRQPGASFLGVLFWVGLALIASSVPVLLPNGSYLDLAFAPIVASMSLGGPVAAAWVSMVGTTQLRELRRQVPWYGILANRCAIASPTVLGALLLQLLPYRDIPLVDFVATLVAGSCYFTLNILVTALIVSLRDQQSTWHQVRSSGGAYLNMLALAPIAWLMAQIYMTAGWWAVLLFAMPLYTTRIAYTRFVEVREMFTQTVSSLAEAVDKRDTFTSGHSQQVQKISVDIGKAMKCSDDEIEALEWGGLLHDIGKIGVPDSVLLKQERLTREERMVMNSHPKLGADIIAPVKRLAPEIPIILHHHEWFNGSGYPDRLVADEIPKLARILHVADAFEAMTAARPYRMTPLTPGQALAELRKFGGIQFDPAVVDAFVKTRWAAGLTDPGRPSVREVPLIGQAAGGLSGGVPAGGMASAGTTIGGSTIEATPGQGPAPNGKGSLSAEPA